MPRKRLILHIGTHKTGTSSFQSSLVDNRPSLMAQGLTPILETKRIDGVTTGTRRANIAAKAHLFIRPELRTPSRYNKVSPELSNRQRQTRRAKLAERLRKLTAPSVLLSAEAFCFLRTPEEQNSMRDFLSQTEREITTLMVLRNEADWRASWENQIQNKPAMFRYFQNQPDEVCINADWYYDISAIRAFWAPFNLTEMSYEAHDNIVDALFHFIGISTAALNTDIRLNSRTA